MAEGGNHLGSGALASGSGQPPYGSGRQGPPIFSRRARQIQADEGILPAPIRPPSSGGTGPGMLRGAMSLEAPLAKGRSRAGTLPSSWGSIDSTERGSLPAPQLGMGGPSFSFGMDRDQVLSANLGRASDAAHAAAAAASRARSASSTMAPISSQQTASYEYPAPTAYSSTSTDSSDFGNASRLRSGSLTSSLSSLGTNPFGPSLFSTTWAPPSAGGSDKADGGDGGLSFQGRPSVVESLDGSEDVRTLDYLGLADPRLSISDRQGSVSSLGVGLGGGASRNRASTLAAGALPRLRGDDGMSSGDFGRGGGLASSAFSSYSFAPSQNLSGSASGLDEIDSRLAPPSLAGQGRLRAGTLAALAGPGGRQRTEQELKRMSGAARIHALLEDPARGLAAPLEGYSGGSAIPTPPPLVSPGILPQDPFGFESSSAASSGWPSSTPNGSAASMRTPTGQVPSRSLYIGNLHSSTTGQALMSAFAPYGAIESLRLLPEKNAGFVNFVEINDAVRARDDVQNRLGSRLEQLGGGPGGTVRIGFGKVDSLPPLPHSARGSAQHSPRPGTPAGAAGARAADGFPSTPGEADVATRALWVGSIPSTTSTATLLSIFAPFGPIESARVLQNKSCAFVNFERIDDAVRARKVLNGRDVLGAEVGAIRIGFAKVPATGDPVSTAGFAAAVEALGSLKGTSSLPAVADQQLLAQNLDSYRSQLVADLMSQQRAAPMQLSASAGAPSSLPAGPIVATPPKASASNSIVPSSDKGGVPLPPDMLPRPTITDLQLLMRELSEGDPDCEAHVASVAELRPPATYYTSIPLVSEVSSARRFDTSRLRDLRKTIENPSCSSDDVDTIARDHMDVIVDLASDYIGNTVVQKLFERCSERVKQVMLDRLAPHLAMIGIHKNGTWAAQKIIDTARGAEQIRVIAQNLRPYVPPLLLDQFGNYVVQCCLPWPDELSDFVFDAMVDRCWEIAQGRFGARSMRACLESSAVSRKQRKRAAMAIILNAVPLATSPNGALLLTWLLDTSNLPGRYRLLVPRFAPHLPHLCTHKLASLTVLRIINQKSEPSASLAVLRALFDAPGSDAVLDDIISDQVHGSMFITKTLASAALEPEARMRYVAQVKRIVQDRKLVGHAAYRRLTDELGLTHPASLRGPFSEGAALGDGGVGGLKSAPAGLPPLTPAELTSRMAAWHLQPPLATPPPPGAAQTIAINPAIASHQYGPPVPRLQAPPLRPFGGGGPSPNASHRLDEGPTSAELLRSPQSDAFNPWSSVPDIALPTGVPPRSAPGWGPDVGPGASLRGPAFNTRRPGGGGLEGFYNQSYGPPASR